MQTILIVDDDQVNREFLVSLLKYHSYRTVEACNGVDALDAVRTYQPALVISDVLMPVMDGYEFIRQLRSDASLRQPKVIFYTATFFEESARSLAESCGVARTLMKPMDPPDILDAIRSVLHLDAPSAPAHDVSEFAREHSRLLTDKLLEKVAELEASNELLRVSEAQYRAFFAANPLPMWIVDPERSCFLAVNDAAVRHYGFSREEFLAMSPTCIGEAADGIGEIAQHSDEGPGGARKSMTIHRTRDGTEIEVVFFSQPASMEGRSVRVVLAEDITERLRQEKKLRDSEQRLRELAARLQSIREEERKKVSRQLHDELGQMLTAMKMDCSWLNARLKDAPEPIRQRVQSTIELADVTIQVVRRLSTELRPGILDMGLAAAIAWQAEEFQARSEMACITDISPGEDVLDEASAIEVFRIFQESLTNVARHSGASEVYISLQQGPDEFLLEVRDNGKGIAGADLGGRHALGILGMHERAALIGGAFEIEDAMPGTRVRIHVPVTGPAAGR